jgi:hypothetical protein
MTATLTRTGSVRVEYDALARTLGSSIREIEPKTLLATGNLLLSITNAAGQTKSYLVRSEHGNLEFATVVIKDGRFERVGGGPIYLVHRGHCSCPDSQYARSAVHECKHVKAMKVLKLI